MTLAKSWKDYLQAHPDVKDLCLILDKAQQLLIPNKTEENFKIIELSLSTVFLSFDNNQNSIIPSFLHSLIGNGLLEKDILMMGLTGLSNSASPVILNQNSFSSFRLDKAPVPDWNDLINNKDKAA